MEVFFAYVKLLQKDEKHAKIMLIICFNYGKVAFNSQLRERSQSMSKMECYTDENGAPKVVMDQNTAHDVKIAIKFFEAGVAATGLSKTFQKMLTVMALEEEFLPKEYSIGNYEVFLDVVKKKIDELIG